MKKGFPLGRFIEGILVVVLLLLLYPAFFWTFRIPIAVNSGGYEQRDFIVTEVYTRREYTRRVYRKRGGWDVKKTIYGYLEGLKAQNVDPFIEDGFPTPKWSPEAHLQYMEEANMAKKKKEQEIEE